MRLVAKGHYTQLVFQFRMLLCQEFAGFNHVFHSLPGIHYLHRTEQNQFAVLRKPAFLSCGFFTVRLEEIGVDRIGDTGNGMSAEEGTLPGAFFQPVATGYKVDMTALI